MRIDMHLHSHHSPDALTKPETIIKVAKKKGLAIAITDHNSATGWKALTKLGKQFKVPVINGMEAYALKDGRFASELLLYFITKPPKSFEIFDLIDDVHKQNGLISIAHPFDPVRKPCKVLKEIYKKVDFIEGFNARCHWHGPNKKAQAFAKKHGIPMTAGGDSHTPEEIGNAFTVVNAETLSQAREQLEKGKTKIFGKLGGLKGHIYTQLAKYNLTGDR